MVVKNLVRCSLGAALALGTITPLQADDKSQPPSSQLDTQQYFRKPETAFDYWRIMKHEIALGQFTLANEYLKGFLAKNPTDQELLQIQEKEGSSAFLRLLTIPALAKDAKPLVDRVGQLVQKFVTDPVRLQKLIKDLTDGSEDPRENAFVINEMRKAGPNAIPALVSALVASADLTKEHALLLEALEKLDHSTTAPLVAALDVDNPAIRAELIDIFRKRAEFSAIPFLWYYSAGADQTPLVRARAQQALTALLGASVTGLPRAKVALTKEAEKYYHHQINLGGAGGPVIVWKWDGKQLVAQTLTSSQAEETYGLHFAGQALKLDAGSEPAQVAFLSLALDKAVERAGIHESLSKTGEVRDLLASVNPDLLIAVLRKALQENRVSVILGATRALGLLAEGKAAQPEGNGQPVLVQALSFPDRRVQIAAADALLRLHRSSPVAVSRIEEVLRRTANADTSAKVLLVDGNSDRANAVAQAIQKAGYQVVISNSGNAALQRLSTSADIDAVVLDASVTEPQLTYLLPQLRADIDAGRMPIIITTTLPEQIAELERRFAGTRGLFVTAETTNAATLKSVLDQQIKAQAGKPLTDSERKDYAALAMIWLARIARGEVTGFDPNDVQGAVVQGLLSNELAPLAVEAAGNLPAPEAQRQLAKVVLDNGRPANLRIAAAYSLMQNLQHFGLHLTVEQVAALKSLYESEPDPKLKGGVAVVVGALRPDPRQTGQRLQRYVPVFGAPTAPKPPAEPTEPKPDAPGGNDK